MVAAADAELQPNSFPYTAAKFSNSTKSTRRSPGSHFECPRLRAAKFLGDLNLRESGLLTHPAEELEECAVSLRVQRR